MEIRTGDPIGIRCPQGRKRHARHTTVSAWPASPDHSFVDRPRSAPRRCSRSPGRPHPITIPLLYLVDLITGRSKGVGCGPTC